MNISESDISILQLSDSFFPTGLYTMSSGLETFFDDKIISNGEQIQSFIETIISQQFGPADCIALANAYDFALSSDIEGIIKCDKKI